MKKLVTTILFLLLITTNISFATEPIEIISYTIPGLTSDIQEFAFNEITNDYTPEVLATDGTILVLYTITSDSILFIDTIPNSPDTIINYKILFEDINRDSIPDILYARYTVESIYTFPTIANCELYFYEGPNYHNPQIISMDSIVSNIGGMHFGKIYDLKALDLDNDKFNELYLSFETTKGYFSIGLNYAYTTGTSVIYNNFPDSISSINGTLMSDLSNLIYPYSPKIANTYYSGWSDSHGSQAGTYTNNRPIIMDSNLEKSLEINRIKEQVIDCPAVVGRDNYNSLTYVCYGPIQSTPHDPIYILLKHSWSQSLTCYDSPMYYKDTSGVELILVNYISEDSVEEIWSYDITGHNYKDFVTLDLARDHYFAFEGNTLFQFSGMIVGAYHKIITLPPGNHKWVYPYSHNRFITRLAITNGNNIKLFDFDITTGIDDNINPDNLPSQFTLSQNYPNPFNPSTVIEYSIPSKGNIKAEVFNIAGQKVITLLDKEQFAGTHQLNWDASDKSSGIYLIKFSYDDQIKSIKTLLLK